MATAARASSSDHGGAWAEVEKGAGQKERETEKVAALWGEESWGWRGIYGEGEVAAAVKSSHCGHGGHGSSAVQEEGDDQRIDCLDGLWEGIKPREEAEVLSPAHLEIP